MDSLVLLLTAAASYLVGAIPFGLLVVKAVKGVDIRELGSGNIGATNVGRVLGRGGFAAVFALDFLKGFGPVAIAGWYARVHGSASPGCVPLAIVAGLAAILGHAFPIYLGFKGGKAVATSTGAFTWLAPWATLIALVTWVVLFAAFRYVSLASICAAFALAVGVGLTTEKPFGQGACLTAFAAMIAILVIARHKGNIGRLLRGEENPFGKVKREE